jgi:shikimate kinase
MSYSTINNIILIGPMGAGKTTIGCQIAKVFDFEFYDSDREIEDRLGASVPMIFELQGEACFRKHEKNIIAELCMKTHIVLATGGGAILKKENQETLRRSGTIVYLSADIDHLLERTAKDTNRPLLQNDNPKEILIKQLIEREPIYQELSDIILTTNQMTVHSAVKELESRLKNLY